MVLDTRNCRSAFDVEHKYDSLPSHDDEHKSPDVAGPAPISQHQESEAEVPELRSIERTILYLKITVAVLVLFLILMVSLHHASSCLSTANPISPLILSPVPPIDLKRVNFFENELYSRRPDDTSDAAWDALLPPGRGFVFIPDGLSKYNLPPGESTPYGPIYSIALFHQMHCLGQIRRFMWLFYDAVLMNGTEGELQREGIRMMFGGGEKGHMQHVNHCFDYLRQTIQCGGDMAVEWPKQEEDGMRVVVDGWDVPHVCKDWDAIMEYMDANHFNMSSNAEIAPLMGRPK